LGINFKGYKAKYKRVPYIVKFVAIVFTVVKLEIAKVPNKREVSKKHFIYIYYIYIYINIYVYIYIYRQDVLPV
jgi:hypothetical protein